MKMERLFDPCGRLVGSDECTYSELLNTFQNMGREGLDRARYWHGIAADTMFNLTVKTCLNPESYVESFFMWSRPGTHLAKIPDRLTKSFQQILRKCSEHTPTPLLLRNRGHAYLLDFGQVNDAPEWAKHAKPEKLVGLFIESCALAWRLPPDANIQSYELAADKTKESLFVGKLPNRTGSVLVWDGMVNENGERL